MIFKQIDSSVDKTRKTLALFNKDWNTYKSNWQNANGIKGKIGSIFTSSNTNTSIISNEQVQILRNWNNAVAHGCTNQETFNRIIANADDNTKMYFAGLNKGKGSIEGLKKAQNVATQSTIGLTIAQTALSMAISLGLTALISLIVKGYDKLANSVENCKERVDDLISSYKSALETANNNANRVEELADKYEKLSKGVNSLGENVSLTNEEYEEYNSLVNEIAEMFPTLVQGWTDEGTAVLNLKGNIEQLRDAYKEAQQEAYNLLIVSGKDSDGNDIIKQWEDTHDTGFWASLLDLGADDVGGGISVSDALKQLKAIQNMTAEEYREIERITGAGSRKEIAGLSDIEKDIGYGSYLYKALGLDSTVTDEDFREAQRQARALIQTYNAEIESALSDVETLANAYLMTNEDYDKLDEQSKTAASMLVNSLNADIANTFSSKEDVGVYVDKIVQSILSNSKAKDALKELFTMNTSDMPVGEIKKQTDSYINTIAEVLKEDPIELKTRLGFDDSDTQPLINNVKEKLQDDFDSKVGELTLDELKIAADLEVSEKDLLSWDELIAKIREVQSSTLNENPIFSNFSDTDFGTRIQHITDLFNEGSISHKEYFDALQSEIDNFDASNFTDSIKDMDKASAQFFVDSMQQTASGLSSLINSFDNGEMSISEYLEGYLAIGNTLNTLTDNLQENSAAWNEHGEAISDVGNTALDDTQNKLNSAMVVIESYQDSIYSLEQIMNDAVKVGSDEFTAHANVIAEDLYRIVQTGGEMADTIANTLGTTTSEIAKSLTENVSNQEIACQAIMANTNNAITDMADSIGELFDTLGDAISNFKVDLSFGIKSIDWKKVNVLGAELNLPEIKFELGASGESLDKIGSALSSFGKTIASNYTPQTIELEDFHFGSTDAAKDRKYSPGSNVIKNYENALDKIKDAASSAKSEYEELFDFFERRIKVLDDALSLLKTNLENVTGSLAKNQLLDQSSSILEERMRNYSDAAKMYQQKAQESLSKLDLETQKKIIDGSVSLTDYIGEGNKAVVEAMNDYKAWSDKVADCTEELANLKEELRQLELDKFNHIIQDFTDQFDLRDNAKNLIDKQIALFKEAGELIGESFYTAQIDQSQKQLTLLENEKAQLVNQMTSAIGSGRVNCCPLLQ